MSVVPPLVALVQKISPGAESSPDDVLLERYVKSRDQAAFELLVWRHGTLVWNVCRRMLAPDCHAAEDACQAVFLALAGHATRLRHKGAIPVWLHRVAVRACLDILASRRATESYASDVVADHRKGPEEIASSREIGRLLDEGVNRLPGLLRIPFVLCELQGKSNLEVARTLGCPIGTVESRLTRARKRLRGWLKARGAAPMVMMAVTGVPAPLEAALIQAGTGAEALSPAIRDLARRAVQSTLSSNLATSLSFALVLAATIAAFGIAASGPQKLPDQPAVPSKEGVKTIARVDAEGIPLPPGAAARLGSSRLRHGDAVADIAFSPDRSRIATAGADRTVRSWDARTGLQLWKTNLGDALTFDVRFTSDGKKLIVAGNDAEKPPIIWTIAAGSGEILARLSLSDTPGKTGYRLSPDGARIAAIFNTKIKSLRMIDTSTGREAWKAELKEEEVDTPAFSPDGRTVAVAAGHTIYLFDFRGKQIDKYKVGENAYILLEFSPDGNKLAVSWRGERNDHLALWDRTTGKFLWSRTIDSYSRPPHRFSPDGKWLTRVGFNHEERWTTFLVDTADGSDKRELPYHGKLGCARFRSDGVLAIGGEKGTILLCDPASGKVVAPSPDPPDGVHVLQFFMDGQTLLGWAQEWYAWDAATGKQRRWTLPPTVSTDGSRCADITGEKENACLEIHDSATGKIISRHRNPFFQSLTSYGFTPDGKGVIGVSFDGTTRIWSTDHGREQITLPSQFECAGRYAISDDGRVLMTVDATRRDGNYTIRIWDLKTGRESNTIAVSSPAPPSVSLSADGRRVAAAISIHGPPDQQKNYPHPHATVWDVSSGKILARMPLHGKEAAVKLSPDGRTLAMSSDENFKLRILEVATGSERMAFEHEGRPIDFIFSPNSKLLAASSGEAPIYLWDVTGDLNGKARWDNAAANVVWDDLSSADAKKAFAAIRLLRANPGPAMAFLNQRLKVLVAPGAEKLGSLFADLASDDFQIREKTMKVIADYDEALRPALEAEIKRSESPEARLRIKQLLDRLDTQIPSRTRLIRVVEAVEGMATSEANDLLKQWTKEFAGTTLASESAAVLARRKK